MLIPGRRSFLIAVSCAAAVLASGNPLARWLGLEYWSSERWLRKVHVLRASALHPDVLLLGSSRVWAGLAPARLETRLAEGGWRATVFNVGLPWGGLMEAAWVLEDVVQSNGCPRLVVVGVSEEGLNANSVDLHRDLRFCLPIRDAIPVLLRMRSALNAEAALDGMLRGFGNLAYALSRPPASPVARAEKKRILGKRGSRGKPQAEPCRDTGRVNVATMGEERRARHLRHYRKVAVDIYRLDEMRLGGLPEWGLERLVDQAQVCRAPLVLVTLPTLFRDQPWSFTAAIRARREYLTRWAEVPGVTYLDLSSLAASMELADFRDPSHLSSCGAARVTDELAAVILEEFGAPETPNDSLAAVTHPPLKSTSRQ